MSRQCYFNGYASCCIDSFFFIFAISRIITFFQNDERFCFSNASAKHCVQHIVLLQENTARNPEFDYDRLELAEMENSECKANFIFKKCSTRVS